MLTEVICVKNLQTSPTRRFELLKQNRSFSEVSRVERHVTSSTPTTLVTDSCLFLPKDSSESFQYEERTEVKGTNVLLD